MAMETMTRVNEQMDVAAKKPMAVQPGVARMRELARPSAVCGDVRPAAGARLGLDQVSVKPFVNVCGSRIRRHFQPTAAAEPVVAEEEPREFRCVVAIGHVLRELRTRDRRTLREVSEKARRFAVHLEVERGQKEANRATRAPSPMPPARPRDARGQLVLSVCRSG